MVGIVIVSHSKNVAEGVKELAQQMAKEVPMFAAGGTSDGRIGTDVEKIINAIESIYSEDGVIIIFDLGSALMNAEMAVESSIGKNILEIEETLKPMKIGKIA